MNTNQPYLRDLLVETLEDYMIEHGRKINLAINSTPQFIKKERSKVATEIVDLIINTREQLKYYRIQVDAYNWDEMQKDKSADDVKYSMNKVLEDMKNEKK